MATAFPATVSVQFCFCLCSLLFLSRCERLIAARAGEDEDVRPDSAVRPMHPHSVNQSALPCEELRGLPVFVLNLDRRTDRLAKFTDVLQREAPWLLRQTCRVSAPDGNAMKEAPSLVEAAAWTKAKERVEKNIKTLGGDLTPGSAALILGHALCWEHIRQHNNFSFGIVFEDDITHLHPDIGELLCRELHMTEKRGWDYLQISHGDVRDSDELAVVEGSDYTTAMYAISQDAAGQALKSYLPVRSHQQQLDSPNQFLRTSKAFKVMPSGASQVGSSSDTDTQIPEGSASLMESTEIPDCAPLDSARMLQPGLLHLGREEK
eukprot:TRINITY_DN103356_c0_g1_i1.p1 TRINITY_DN103356_c0_g1~~TRINITY_DN103356_c0_g1_i1.p1  ORF type:complete len:361 (+),score=55.01 TRINITY_DN103356_c0_g1_i1:121-1083(+)